MAKYNIHLFQDKKQRGNYLDRIWLDVMLCLIGESLDEDSKVVSATNFWICSNIIR